MYRLHAGWREGIISWRQAVASSYVFCQPASQPAASACHAHARSGSPPQALPGVARVAGPKVAAEHAAEGEYLAKAAAEDAAHEAAGARQWGQLGVAGSPVHGSGQRAAAATRGACQAAVAQPIILPPAQPSVNPSPHKSAGAGAGGTIEAQGAGYSVLDAALDAPSGLLGGGPPAGRRSHNQQSALMSLLYPWWPTSRTGITYSGPAGRVRGGGWWQHRGSHAGQASQAGTAVEVRTPPGSHASRLLPLSGALPATAPAPSRYPSRCRRTQVGGVHGAGPARLAQPRPCTRDDGTVGQSQPLATRTGY